MAAVFQTLGALGSYLESRGNVEVVDPGMPLSEWTADLNEFGPAWKNQPSVRKVVGFAARNTASVPLHLFERKSDQDRKRLRDGPLAELLRKPSRAPGRTPFRFWETVLIDGLLNDRYCVQVVEHIDGFELVRIPARRVKFSSDSFGRIETVLITGPDGKRVERDPADYIIDVGYSEKGANGTSPLETLKDLLAESREAVAYRRSIWKNGARIPGVLEHPTKFPNPEARAKFGTGWKAFVSGGGGEGGTPVLEDGIKWKEVNAFRPKDTNDLEGRRLTDAEVASAYYIAPELVGARESTFGNIQAFKEMLFGPALGPYIIAWEQQLNASLVARFHPGEDVYIEANIEAKMRGSFETQAEVLSKSIGAPWMTRNEGRGRMNLSAIDGGDELITPLNVLIGGQASPMDGKSLTAVLEKFSERQEKVVASQKAAGADAWDRARWDRELTVDLVKAGYDGASAAAIAAGVNDQAEQRLMKEIQ